MTAPAIGATSVAAAPRLVFSVARDLLTEALAKALYATPKKTTLPVLTHALVESEESSVRITTTDIDQTLTVRMLAVTQPGIAVLVPIRMLAAIVAQLPPAPIRCTVKGRGLALTAGRSRFALPSMDVAEFPTGTVPLGEPIPLSGRTLAAALARVAPHVSTEASRPILGGILIDARPDALDVFATDSYSGMRVRLGTHPALRGRFILPREAVAAIGRLFEGADEITLRAGSGAVELAGADAIFRTRLIDGPYPDYGMFFGRATRWTVEVDRAAFTAMIKRVCAPSDAARVECAWRDGEVAARVVHEAGAQADDTMAATVVAKPGPDTVFRIAWSRHNLLPVLASIGGDTVRLSFTSQTGATYVTDAARGGAQGTAESGDIGVLMPVRVPEPPKEGD